jgi:hypothetical protein
LGYFTELGIATNKAIELLIADEILVKLLYYDTEDAIYKPTVANPESLINTKIYPVPKIPQVQTEACTMLNVFFDEIQQNHINKGYRDEVLKILIIMHLDLFLIQNNIRLYAIMEQIDKIFNNKYYSEIAGHSLQPVGKIRLNQINDNFFGCALSYGMVNDSNVGIR